MSDHDSRRAEEAQEAQKEEKDFALYVKLRAFADPDSGASDPERLAAAARCAKLEAKYPGFESRLELSRRRASSSFKMPPLDPDAGVLDRLLWKIATWGFAQFGEAMQEMLEAQALEAEGKKGKKGKGSKEGRREGSRRDAGRREGSRREGSRREDRADPGSRGPGSRSSASASWSRRPPPEPKHHRVSRLQQEDVMIERLNEEAVVEIEDGEDEETDEPVLLMQIAIPVKLWEELAETPEALYEWLAAVAEEEGEEEEAEED